MSKYVHEPDVITDQPFPGIEDDTNGSNSGGASDSQRVVEHSPREIPERSFPVPSVASILISDSFDSQTKRILSEYQFGLSGALQIGKYEENVSGDVRISPSGIIGRNLLGETTFTLDAATGDATFKGIVQAGTLISGIVAVGNNRWVIDGDAEFPSIRLYDESDPPKVSIFIGEL